MVKDKPNKGEANTSPKGDMTQKQRQARRRDRLNEKARVAGFASWSAYETAVLNDAAKLGA